MSKVCALIIDFNFNSTIKLQAKLKRATFDTQYSLLNWSYSLITTSRVSSTIRLSNRQQQNYVFACEFLFPSLISSCSVKRSRSNNHFHSLYCLTLFQRPFVFPNPVGFDHLPLSWKFSFALLSCSNNYYLSFRIHTNLGAWVLLLTGLPIKNSVASGNENNIYLLPSHWKMAEHIVQCGDSKREIRLQLHEPPVPHTLYVQVLVVFNFHEHMTPFGMLKNFCCAQ